MVRVVPGIILVIGIFIGRVVRVVREGTVTVSVFS